MNDLTLLDLECILIDDNRKNFDIELNEKKIYNVDSNWLWRKIHSESIEVAEIVADSFVYIKLQSNELILLL